jgi:hypothetical protein
MAADGTNSDTAKFSDGTAMIILKTPLPMSYSQGVKRFEPQLREKLAQ